MKSMKCCCLLLLETQVFHKHQAPILRCSVNIPWCFSFHTNFYTSACRFSWTSQATKVGKSKARMATKRNRLAACTKRSDCKKSACRLHKAQRLQETPWRRKKHEYKALKVSFQILTCDGLHVCLKTSFHSAMHPITLYVFHTYLRAFYEWFTNNNEAAAFIRVLFQFIAWKAYTYQPRAEQSPPHSPQGGMKGISSLPLGGAGRGLKAFSTLAKPCVIYKKKIHFIMCVCLWAALMWWLCLCLSEQVHNAQPQPPHRSSFPKSHT